jgi:hypothetical protein
VTKGRGLGIADLGADGILDRRLRRLEQIFRLLDPQVLQVVARRHAGGRPEPAQEGALSKPALRDHAGHRVGPRIVVREPDLARGHDLVVRVAPSCQRGVGQLPVAVPLQKVELGDPPRLLGPCDTSDQVEQQVVPGRGAARGDQPVPLARRHQHALAPHPDAGVPPRQHVAIAPVRRRLLPVEQAGFARSSAPEQTEATTAPCS